MKLVSFLMAATLALVPVAAMSQNSEDGKQRAGAPLLDGFAIPLEAIPQGTAAAAGLLLIIGGGLLIGLSDDDNPATSATSTQ